MKKSIYAVASMAVAAITLAACGAAPESEETTGGEATSAAEESTEAAGDFKACLVSDAGGWDDQSFNQAALEGLELAADELGVETNTVESTDDSDYGPNIDNLIQDGCTYIIGVGYLLEQAIEDAAVANEDIEFGLIDSALSDEDGNTLELPNVKPLLFNTVEAAYLAGYLAAGMTESGIVGTYGGLPIPSVTIFMDGFVDGVAQYNEENSTSVTVLGWDKETQEGQFAGTFDDQAQGTTIAQSFLDQGADIIMPVAGPVGLGSATPIQSAGGTMIWVDSDGYNSTQYGDIILTSVMKEIGASVYDSTEEALGGEFNNTPYVGNLENEGVGLAPFHDFESAVPTELAERVQELQEEIIAGTLVVESVSSPS